MKRTQMIAFSGIICRCCVDSIILDHMRETTRQLAHANRRNKQRDATSRKEKMAEAIIKNKARDLFQEIENWN